MRIEDAAKEKEMTIRIRVLVARGTNETTSAGTTSAEADRAAKSDEEVELHRATINAEVALEAETKKEIGIGTDEADQDLGIDVADLKVEIASVGERDITRDIKDVIFTIERAIFVFKVDGTFVFINFRLSLVGNKILMMK